MINAQTAIIEDPVMALMDHDLLDLLVAFTFIDGELDEKEWELLQEIAIEYQIPHIQLQAKVEEYRQARNYEERCYAALDKITSPNMRERLIGPLCSLATADGVHHENELKFLNAIRERWKIDISIGRQLHWDPDQEAVIRASYRDRIIVHAGPGMGKTAVACARVSELIDQHVTASNIWMLSFTRTAVKEIRDRISSFSDHEFSSIGVKVATIDSRAWEMRYGMTEEKVEQLFGGYEQSIQSVLELFQSKKDELREEFENIEHVIIDEAQDIIGVRAKLLIAILDILSPHCGFTIFADPAQAIYGFAEDDDDDRDSSKHTFLDMVRQHFGVAVTEKELKKIHRTTNPKLIQLIEDMRLDIYVADNVDKKRFSERKQYVKDQADRLADEFNSNELKDNTLVLFRRRAEVLQASYHACNDGIPHRLRMSGHIAGIFSWIGHLFYDFPNRKITKEEFLALCNTKSAHFHEEGADFDAWWKLLYSTAGRDEWLDLTQLRVRLSRNPPPVHLCYSDLGRKGAILGTIHASKGREADNVILRLPVTGGGADADYDEESRVLFVGATRAKDELAVGAGFAASSFSSSLLNGRAYRKHKGSWAFVEVGLAGDLDEYSFVSKRRHIDDIEETQRKLIDWANRTPCKMNVIRNNEHGEYCYSLWTQSGGKEVDRAIGEFDQKLNRDLFDVRDCIGARTTPSQLNGVYMLGLRTVCKSENDPLLRDVHEPYRSTGMWLMPVVIGNSLCSFARPTRARSE